MRDCQKRLFKVANYLDTVQTNVIYVYRIINPRDIVSRFSSKTYEVSCVICIYRPGMRDFPTTLLSASVRVETNKRVNDYRSIALAISESYNFVNIYTVYLTVVKGLKYMRILIKRNFPK